ncbi:MAG: hypothetical protein ACJ8CR_27255 [Roseiflexaceae bacterium]
MHKLIVLTVVGWMALMSLSAASASSERTVRVVGGDDFKPNTKITSNLRFSPGPLSVRSGDTITWVDADDEPDEPHTITIVEQSALPTSFATIDACYAPAAPCSTALMGHFPLAEQTPPDQVVQVLDPDHDGGLSTPGDSLVLFPNGSVSANVTAPAGTTLSYLCAIHPWMQGTINVR